jgi:transitional endoplasmic reticulum ATPase
MAETEARPLRLQVANARPRDAGLGIARLGHAALTQLGLLR